MMSKNSKSVHFFEFFKFILSRDVPGQRSLSRDICSWPCPGTKGHRDRQNFFVPGQRDNGTSCPCLSRDVPRDVPSLGNPSIDKLICLFSGCVQVHAVTFAHLVILFYSDFYTVVKSFFNKANLDTHMNQFSPINWLRGYWVGLLHFVNISK